MNQKREEEGFEFRERKKSEIDKERSKRTTQAQTTQTSKSQR